jgi:hypothetical protein
MWLPKQMLYSRHGMTGTTTAASRGRACWQTWFARVANRLQMTCRRALTTDVTQVELVRGWTIWVVKIRDGLAGAEVAAWVGCTFVAKGAGLVDILSPACSEGRHGVVDAVCRVRKQVVGRKMEAACIMQQVEEGVSSACPGWGRHLS